MLNRVVDRRKSIPASWCVLILFSVATVFLLISGDNCENSSGEYGYEPDSLDEFLDNLPMDVRVMNTSQGMVTYAEVESLVFSKLGYRITSTKVPVPELELLSKGTCQQLFFESSVISSSRQPQPLREIPLDMKNEFTLFAFVHTNYSYKNDEEERKERTWTNIEELVASGTGKNHDMSSRRSLERALEEFAVKNMKGWTFGFDRDSWMEVAALSQGAEKISVSGSLPVKISGTTRVNYVDPVDLAKAPNEELDAYDFAMMYSYLEYYGLGRFGDSVDPLGDIRELKKVRCLLKTGGLLFLGLPRGQDTLIFNEQRIYGKLRLALAFTDFEHVATFRANTEGRANLTSIDLDGKDPSTSLEYDTFVLKKT